MKSILLLLGILSSLCALDSRATIALQTTLYEPYKEEKSVEADIRLHHQEGDYSAQIALEYFASDRYIERRYLQLQELFLKYQGDMYDLRLGKEIRYLGELEGYNSVDLYNQKNILKDPFDKAAKLGTWGGNFEYYFDENSVGFFFKLQETPQKVATGLSPYSPFERDYTKQLAHQKSEHRPSLGLLYKFFSQQCGTQTTLGIFHGYDTKRNFILHDAQTLAQESYLVNKIFLSSHALMGTSLLKLEGTYTDVISYEAMADYMQLAFGLEHTLESVSSLDITLFVEYYHYKIFGEGVRDVDIAELYDNDLFLATRITFFDTASSEIKGGILHDLSGDEEIIKVEAKSRLLDRFILKAEFLQTISKARAKRSLLAKFGNTSRAQVSLAYSF